MSESFDSAVSITALNPLTGKHEVIEFFSARDRLRPVTKRKLPATASSVLHSIFPKSMAEAVERGDGPAFVSPEDGGPIA